MGKSRIKAAEDAVTEIALAVIATTMSIVAVFAPTAMMQGIPGMLFKQFGWTAVRSEEHTSELQSLMRISYAVFCLKKKKTMSDTSTSTTDSHSLHSGQTKDI